MRHQGALPKRVQEAQTTETEKNSNYFLTGNITNSEV